MSNCFGRDSGSSEFGLITPVVPTTPSLCATMGKELSCEGSNGTARIVWCTTEPATEKIYFSIVSASGPWILMHDDQTVMQKCHQVDVPILGIGQHWFYVESEFATGHILQGTGIFCTDGTVLIVDTGLFLFANTITNKTKTSLLITNETASDQHVIEDNQVANQPEAGTPTLENKTKNDHIEYLTDDHVGMANLTHAFV